MCVAVAVGIVGIHLVVVVLQVQVQGILAVEQGTLAVDSSLLDLVAFHLHMGVLLVVAGVHKVAVPSVGGFALEVHIQG